MKLNEVLNIVVAFFSGVGLGTLFFYSLWRTVSKFKIFKNSLPLIFGSSFVRIVIVLLGFYFVTIFDFFGSEAQFSRIISCLVGFFITRFTFTRIIQFQLKDSLIMREVKSAP